MTTANTSKPVRLPHGWNAKLQQMTGYTQPTVTRVIQAVDITHPVWTAYEELLTQEVKAKTKTEQEKHERLIAAQRLRNKLAA